MNQTTREAVAERVAIWWRERRLQWSLFRHSFVGDRRGGTAVQALVILPVFIVGLVTLIWLWRITLVRRTFHTGTYQAMRYLSLYPPVTANPALWSDVAEQIVANHVRNNPFVDRQDLIGTALEVSVEPPGELGCGEEFIVNATFRLRMPSVEPFPAPPFALQEQRRGEILCD